MTLNPDHVSLLSLVDRFCAYSRYGGVMPLRLLATQEDLVDDLVGREMLRCVSSRSLQGCAVEGVTLTAAGRLLLREE